MRNRWFHSSLAALALLLVGIGSAWAQQQPCAQSTMPKIVSGSSYLLTTNDRCGLIILTNSGVINVQLPAPGLIFAPSFKTTVLPLNGGAVTFTGLQDQSGNVHLINGQTTLALTTGEGAVLSIEQDVNWYALISNAVGGNQLVFDTNAALKSATAGTIMAAIRLGFAAPGDGGLMTYFYSSSACTLNAGAGDDGLQVAPASGPGCYLAQYGAETDLRVWGPGGSADDTAQLTAATAALAGGMRTSFVCGSSFTFDQWLISAANVKIRGTPNCVFNATAGALTSDDMLNYIGGGSLEIAGVTWKAPVFNYTTWALPAVQKFIRIDAAPAAVPTQHVIIRDNVFYGGQAAVECHGCLYVDMLNDYAYNSYNDSFTVIPPASGNGALYSHSAHVHMDVHCFAGGSYCAAPLADQTVTGTATSDIKIEVDAKLMGFINDKFCVDVTTGQASDIYVHLKCTDGWDGGVELKVGTNPESPVAGLPAYFKAAQADVQCLNHFNRGGYCLQINNPSIAANPDLFGQTKASAFATYALPALWLALNYYDYGDVIQRTSGGVAYTFAALGPGTSGGVGSAPVPPGGNCDGLAHSVYTGDGTVPAWLCVEATSPVSTDYGAATVQAVTNLDLTVTALNTAFGVEFNPTGSSDNTIRNVTVRLTAVVNDECVTDRAGNAGGTIDHVSFVGTSCISGRSDGNVAGNEAFLLGTATWTAAEIDGGSIKHVGLTTGSSLLGWAIRSAHAGHSVALKVTGARIAGGAGAYFIDDDGWAVTQAGGTVETLNAAGGPPILEDGAGSTGPFLTEGPVGVNNSASAASGAWALTGGATATIGGRFISFPSATNPNGSQNCNYGEVVPSRAPGAGGQPVNGWYCSTPGTGWTAF